MKISELSYGDRFWVTFKDQSKSLWTIIDFDDGLIICRRHERSEPGSHEAVCHFEKDQEVEFVPAKFEDLTDAQRLEIFKQYCTHCGNKNPQCRCWDDE